VPAISGCATQEDTFEELIKNLYEAVDKNSEIMKVAI